MYNYETFKVTIEKHVAHVAFNRPHKSNSLNAKAWEEMKHIFETIDDDPEVRAVVLQGEGKNFCAGIDLALLMNIQQYNQVNCEGRKRELVRKFMKHLQDCITAIEKCRKPVLAAIHRACIGGALDVVSACDMRYCTEDAYFSIREIDLGLVADIGTLQRLPKLINYGMVAEMAYTGRNVGGKEARDIKLVNQVYATKADMVEAVTKIAELIATKSPLCIRGTKNIIQYTRDHSVEESLNYMVAWNAGMLLSNDLEESFKAYIEKRKPVYEG